jgi:aminoacrylate hydrolase
MPKVSIGDAEINYEMRGEGEPLLLVAGLGGALGYWTPNISEFARHYKVILHDHRGTGQSSHSQIDYSVEQMTSDLIKLMDKLGIENAHIVGHSTGGAMAQVMAIDHPERLKSAVIYASWTKSDAFMRRVMEIRRTLLEDSGPAAYVKATPVFLYPDWWINENERVLSDREPKGIETFPTVQIAVSRIEAVLAFDRVADLDRITVPTLIVCAKDDFLTPPYFSEALKKAIPGSELRMLEKGGHACSEAARDEFNRVVLDFLSRHKQ